MERLRKCLMIAALLVGADGAEAQQTQAPQASPPPATKIEAFKPVAGSVLTLG